MNKKGLFLMGLAAIAFASCSNEDLVSGNSGTTVSTVTGEGEPTYFTFSLNVNDGTKTRSYQDGNHIIKDGADEVVTISKAYVFLYNESSKVLEDTILIQDLQADRKYTKLVKAGKKRIFVVANPTTTMEDSLKTMIPNEPSSTLDKFLGLTFEAKASSDLGALLSSPMPMTTPDNGRIYELEPSVSEDEAPSKNKVALQLKRMLAKTKITFAGSATASNGKSGISSNKDVSKYTVRNHSKSTYLIQNVSTGIVKSPTYNNDIKDYTDGFGEFFLMDGKPTAPIDSLLYIAENTSYSFLKGAAPYVILHTRYLPSKIVESVTYDEFVGNISYGYDVEVNDSDVATMVVADSTSTAALLPVGMCFKSKELFNKAITEAQKINPDFKATYIDYSGGSYYRINLGKTESGSTIYGTARNTIYNVNIKSVTGPGWNTEHGANESPTDPVDQKTYVNVDITVAPWDDANQDVDLN